MTSWLLASMNLDRQLKLVIQCLVCLKNVLIYEVYLIKSVWRAAVNIACYGQEGNYCMLWPCSGQEDKCYYLYKADYSSHQGSFWCSAILHNIFIVKLSLLSNNITLKNYDSFMSYTVISAIDPFHLSI